MSDKSSTAVDGREPDPLLHEALDWIVRLKTGEPTRDDVEALQRWRAQSPVHEAAFARAVRVFRHAGVAAHELADRPASPGIVPAIAPVAVASRSPAFARRALLGGAIAALLVLGVTAGGALHVQHEREAERTQQQFEAAMRVTDRALDQAQQQLQRAGLRLGN